MTCQRTSYSECQGQIYVNLFFDGTGNNRDWNGTFISGKTRSTQTQLVRNGHSNVARLYDASFEEPGNGLFRIYIPGVGTPFKEIGDSGEGLDGMLGGGAALKGADRIHWGIVQVLNTVHRYLFDDAPLIPDDQAGALVNEMSATSLLEGMKRRALLNAIAVRLKRVVDSHQRRVQSINIAVFGFSRGAAEARAFVHRLYEIAEVWGSGCGHNIAGIPMQVSFMGIFDTVASVGIAGISRFAQGKMDWADGEMMSIHPEVKKCMHFVALHEQRINFPVDLAARGTEVMYPGMHSDVGGGYTPGGQGKDFVNGRVDGTAKLAQIPLVDMHYEALKAGVPMRTLSEMEGVPGLVGHFTCSTTLVADYNAWLSSHGMAGGDHAAQVRNHNRQYVKWKGLRLWGEGDENLLRRPFYLCADDEDKYDLAKAQEAFGRLLAPLLRDFDYVSDYERRLAEYRAADQAWLAGSRTERRPVPPRRIASADREHAPTRELVEAARDRTPLPPAVVRLFDNYVHDSLAGFYISGKTELTIPGFSTYGYLRYRDVFKVDSSYQSPQCIDPRTTPMPPANVPSMGQIFQMMGR